MVDLWWLHVALGLRAASQFARITQTVTGLGALYSNVYGLQIHVFIMDNLLNSPFLVVIRIYVLVDWPQ